jgi:GNAT superfamily N-acetyltransferase
VNGPPGGERAAAELGPRIAALAGTATDTVLVAEVGGRVVGMASLHVTPLFTEGHSRGRLTALVVDPGQRRRGVGRLLLQAVEAAARARGCVALELTSRPDRRGAHRFYLAARYQDRPYRFFKQLDPAGDQQQGGEAPGTG